MQVVEVPQLALVWRQGFPAAACEMDAENENVAAFWQTAMAYAFPALFAILTRAGAEMDARLLL